MEFTEGQKFFHEVVKKAWDDAEFKSELLADPLAAIEKFTGKKFNLPEGKKLVVRDQTSDTTVYINVPPQRVADDVELNEEQLEAVAGGSTPPGMTTGCWDPNHGDNSGNSWDTIFSDITNSTKLGN